jgi:TMEM175 potassium channel family protein
MIRRVEAGQPMQPRERGKRARDDWELEFSRVVAFSDGVFAIAMTLLVLNLEVPSTGSHLWADLADLLPQLVAYALSFAVIGRLWVIHHRFFAEVTHFDGRLITVNLLYLGLIVLIPFTTELLGEYGDQSAAVAPYALNIGVVTLVGSFMVYDAVRSGLTRPGMEWVVESPQRWGGLPVAAVFLASIPIAFVSPTLAELSWATLILYGLWGPKPG